MAEQEVNLFHQHLGRCQQCREQPFNLCPKGAFFLQHEGSKAIDSLAKAALDLSTVGK